MILSSHSVIGVAAASITPANPILGFLLAFLSHFLVDMIPHWDYDLSKGVHPEYADKIAFDKAFALDVVKISLDIFVGVVASYYLLSGVSDSVLLLGVTGGIVPDILQFLYGKFKIKPLILFKKFHDCVHAEKYENMFIFGVFTQILVVALVVVTYGWFI